MIKVEEIKAMLPQAEVYCLTPEAKYLVIIRQGSAARDTIAELSKILNDMGLSVCLITVHSPGELRIFECLK